MKRLTLLLAILCITLYSQAQQIKIVSFTVKNQLPSKTDDWQSIPGALILTAQKPPTAQIKELKLVLQIKSNGAVICGNNVSNAATLSEFTTKTFTTSELIGLLGNCPPLKDGNYTICAQFFNSDRREASQEMCREFRVEAPKETDYASPTLINPNNDKKFTEKELQGPVMFRWTPLVPKPKEPVTYRLRVWQLMQGQNGMAAIKANQPIIEKDVREITQAVVTGVITGPCKPPYMCDFIWNVQAVNKEGKPMGRNEGTSEAWSFGATNPTANSITNISPVDKKQFTLDEAKGNLTFRWTPLVPKPQEPVTYRLKVWQLMQGQNGTQAMKSNQPIITKDVNNVTETSVTDVITGPCKPPYMCDFIWNVQALDRTGQVLGETKEWSFGATSPAVTSSLANVFPTDKKQFTLNEAKGNLTFRWTPLVPKPQEPVTYRLKVWQLMQGQNGTQAMKSNQPIITKEVENLTEANVSSILTGPCKPPYMCDFIWNVQAVNKEGKPMGRNEGTSEAWSFSVAGTYAINIDSLQIDCPIDTKYNFKVKLCNPNNATAIFDKLELVIVNGGVLGTPLNITSVTPAIGTTIPANGCIWVTGFFNYATPFTQACIKGYIKDQALPGLNKAESFTCDSLYCACDPCKTLGVSLKDDKLTTTATTSGQILLSGTLVGLNPNVVKKITMELVFYNIEQTGDSNCVKCAENKEWGNFIKPSSSAFTGYNTGLLNGINFGREWTWLTTVQKDCNGGGHNDNGGVDNPTLKATCATCGTMPPNNASNPNAKVANTGGVIIIDPGPPNPKANSFALPIAVPPGSSLKCCGDKIKICIRYTIWDFCCHSCDIIKCYEIERKAQ